MLDLKFPNLQQRFKIMKRNTRIRRLPWRSSVSLSLMLVIVLSGCATESAPSKIELKPLQLETQFNASDWNRRLEDYFLRQDRLLSTVEGRLAGNNGAGPK
nr:MAG TPA: periplasmic binding protein [Caudoviricetes sp.]